MKLQNKVYVTQRLHDKHNSMLDFDSLMRSRKVIQANFIIYTLFATLFLYFGFIYSHRVKVKYRSLFVVDKKVFVTLEPNELLKINLKDSLIMSTSSTGFITTGKIGAIFKTKNNFDSMEICIPETSLKYIRLQLIYQKPEIFFYGTSEKLFHLIFVKRII